VGDVGDVGEPGCVDMNTIVGTHDIVLVTLDTLRFDVARDALQRGDTPAFAALIPSWQLRHSPATFTFAAHQAFFAGFFPATSNKEPRLFALRFPGSDTTTPQTCVLDGPDIVSGLGARGYHTACIGGVGFFNKQNALGSVLPGLFDESHWDPSLGVTDPASTENQVARALAILAAAHSNLFLFVNVSALHQPNWHYLPGARAEDGDSLASHAAALRYVDGALMPLWRRLGAREKPTFCLVCSDHGTAYGEDGFVGHRVAHPSVWNVPYATFILGGR
jgi:Sulfatase